MAAVKLLGGPDHEYDPNNKNHVSAVMAARVKLDVAIAKPRAFSFSADAVNAHLRVVKRIHIDPPTFETRSPSEPITARAASELLCKISNTWNSSLRTLRRELLSPGFLDAGPWGELAARYLMILAQDHLRFSPTDRIDSSKMFTVHHLLRSLLNSTHYHVLDHLDQDISESWMNFSHFVSTSSSVKKDEQLGSASSSFDVTPPFNMPDVSETMINIFLHMPAMLHRSLTQRRSSTSSSKPRIKRKKAIRAKS